MEFGQIIHASCMRLQVAIQKLRVGKALQEECIEINRLENEADDLVPAGWSRTCSSQAWTPFPS